MQEERIIMIERSISCTYYPCSGGEFPCHEETPVLRRDIGAPRVLRTLIRNPSKEVLGTLWGGGEPLMFSILICHSCEKHTGKGNLHSRIIWQFLELKDLATEKPSDQSRRDRQVGMSRDSGCGQVLSHRMLWHLDDRIA